MESGSDKPMSFDEALAVTRGESLSKYREQQQLTARLQKQAERYVDLPPNQWPKLSFNWDLSPDSQRFAFDGVELESFRKHYPNGLVLGHSSI